MNKTFFSQNNIINLKLILILVFMLQVMVYCKKDDDVRDDYIYNPPVQFDDGLQTASLESVGMSSGSLVDMMNYLNSNSGHLIHNILILKNNKLVFEEYFEGYKLVMNAPHLNGELMEYNKSTDHFMASVSKSVTSVVFGIAVKDGYITDLNNKVIEYLPEYNDILIGEKANITIHHLLTMTSGLAFDESTYPYSDSRNELRQTIDNDDPVRYILSKPVVSSPGTQFHYSSGCGIVLAAILEKATGLKFIDYANQNLFDPLRSEGGVWTSCQNGLIFASGGLYFRARELSKIGLLFLNAGMWDGKQIITPDWINSSQYEHVSPVTDLPPFTSYGYQWWITNYMVKGTSYKCFAAVGWGGQFMFIIPGLDLIIEFNSGNYEGISRISPFNLLNDYILKAIN